MATFNATSGNDTFSGTAGNDIVSYANAWATTGGISVSLASNGGQFTGGSGTDTFFSIENLIGSSFDDILYGNLADNIIDGGAGIDKIHGGSGTNTLSGSDGNDILYSDSTGFHDNLNGGNGNDTLEMWGILGGVIDGGAGIDTLDFSSPYGQFDGTSGSATFANIEQVQGILNGTTGDDIVSLAMLTGATGLLTINGGNGNDIISGGSEIDTIHGGSGTNTLNGGNGNDILYSDSNGFHDNLNGGNGDDILRVLGVLGGTIDGGTGIDTLDFTSPYGQFDGTTGSAKFKNIEHVQGILNGTTGNDVVSLATLTKATGTLTINAGDGNDSITGGSEIDTINGGNGNDRIQDGLGADILTGGSGIDTFVYTAINQSGVTTSDHITDFVSGTDKINLHGIDANSSLAGNQDFVFVGTSPFTGLGQVNISYVGGHAILSANTTGDLAADFSVVLDNGATLNIHDLIL